MSELRLLQYYKLVNKRLRPSEAPSSDTARQLEVHELANFLNSRAGTSAVVVLTKHPQLLSKQYPGETKLFIATDTPMAPDAQKAITWLPPDTEFLDSRGLDESFLADKVMVNIDYIDLKSILPRQLLQRKRLQILNMAAAISIVTVRQTPYWSLATLGRLFSNQPFAFIGKLKQFSGSPLAAERGRLIAIGGQLLDIKPNEAVKQKVLAVIPAFNENDMLAATVKHLLKQGVDVHVLDNWSSDGSYETAELLADKYPGRVSCERFPAKAVKKWEWFKLLSRVTEVAKERDQYKWIMLNDADEIRWSPWTGVSLQQAFSAVGSLGFNAIDYTVFTVKPVIDGFGEKDDPEQFFEYGEFAQEEAYFIQVKSWQNHPKADLASGGGHHVAFPAQRIYPIKFLLNHYPLRSNKQAQEKVFKNRQPRLHKEERDKGWNVHYDNITKNTNFVADKDTLLNFRDSSFKRDYLLERIAGVGIIRKK